MNSSEKSRHQQRQQKLKEKVDERIAAATQDKGLLLVITGNGKGKSTAGFGMVSRTVGHGMKAAVAQFIKGSWACGERNLLQSHGVPFAVMATGFTWETQNRELDIAAAQAVWQQAKVYLQDPAIHLVLLDELTYMLTYDYISLDEVLMAL
ncbi:cob(I)yrinic acid a,c-diamide adenosyltransferase, partial [Rheinheimera sp.]|uniref:cob(I)yrinic acid a,c-diamide adenosyltransferase n=1 Tax=Rheinheimera sp. TaxID=1869214 RepID=UPI0027BA894D